MEIKIENGEKNIVNLDIEFTAEEMTKEYDKVCKQVSHNVKVPGFRPGKAPKKLVEKQVGVDYLKSVTLEQVLPQAFRKAVIDNKLDIITEPQVLSFDYNVGEGAKVKAQIELRPEVEITDYKGLEVEVEEFKNASDALDKEIDNLVKRFTTLEKSEKTEAGEKDTVQIDFEGFVDGEPIKNGKGSNYMLDLGNSNFIPGFAEAIVGHSLNEEFDINVKFPDEYHDENIKGKPAVFKIKINEIKEKKVPEVNDEFAKKVGNFETLEALKEDIQKYLDEAQNNENQKRKAVKIFEAVVNNGQVEISESMIERETRNILSEYSQRFKAQGIDFNKLMESQGNDAMIQNMKLEAEKRIKNSLVITKIAQLENINVSPDDLENKIEEISKAYNTDKNLILEEIRKNNAIIGGITQQVLNDKVTQFLVENNNVKYVEQKVANN